MAHNKAFHRTAHKVRCPVNADVRHKGETMKYAIISLGLLLACSNAFGEMAAETNGQPRVINLCTDHSPHDGTVLKYDVLADDLLRTPEWTGHGDPPMSIASASTIALDFLKHENPDCTEFEPWSITLTPSHDQNTGPRWHYHLEFMGMIDAYHPSRFLNVYVLFDGTIVKPRSEKIEAEQSVAGYPPQGVGSPEP